MKILRYLSFIRKFLGWRLVKKRPENIPELLECIKKLDGEVVCVKNYPAAEACFGSFGKLDERLVSAVQALGVERLYSHQSLAVEYALDGHDFVIVTPTASGKTLCYNLPVFNAVLKDSSARAMYLFPAKALAQDQLNEIEEIAGLLDCDIKSFAYDGDMPAEQRRIARETGNIIITNPDMLSSGILPHHNAWAEFFRSLKYVVVDEVHSYRGFFGSHLANVFVRLERICKFYGASPVFICCSATIANPKEHAEALIGRKMKLIAESGAPVSEKSFMIYSPKLLNKKTGVRRSSLFESARIASLALRSGISTIVFTRSRLNAELLLKALRKKLADNGENPEIVTGYRGGYLSRERRAIEQGLRTGKIRGVVSTNALELGVDIGALDFAVLHGYPGSIASLRQQIGRVGRRGAFSASVMVISATPSDRFFTRNPGRLFSTSAEHARINPVNPYILVNHVCCSVFELPFYKGEKFGGNNIDTILEYFTKQGLFAVSNEGGKEYYRWTGNYYPAAACSLRSASGETYRIIDVSDTKRRRWIGTIDKVSSASLIFPGAIYVHRGQSYMVIETDTQELECRVKLTSCDYYTESDESVRINIKNEIKRDKNFGWAEAVVAHVPRLYRKIKLTTHETVGYGEVNMPEEKMMTEVCWIALSSEQENPLITAAVDALARLVKNIAPIFLMCDEKDLLVKGFARDVYLNSPAVFIADNIPGGAGLAEGAYENMTKILQAAYNAVADCDCKNGCPACIGEGSRKPENFKGIVCNILSRVLL